MKQQESNASQLAIVLIGSKQSNAFRGIVLISVPEHMRAVSIPCDALDPYVHRAAELLQHVVVDAVPVCVDRVAAWLAHAPKVESRRAEARPRSVVPARARADAIQAWLSQSKGWLTIHNAAGHRLRGPRASLPRGGTGCIDSARV